MSRLTNYTIVRVLRIDAGHRVYGHEGRCASVHGHSYSFHIYLSAPSLDVLGRVLDFGAVKHSIGSWLEDKWDHSMILWELDPISKLWTEGDLVGNKYFLLPFNPTAEALASYLLKRANELIHDIDDGLTVTRVDCWETPSCMAIAEV